MASIFKREGTWYVRWRSDSGWTQRATEAKSWQEAKRIAAELELQESGKDKSARFRVEAAVAGARVVAGGVHHPGPNAQRI